MAAAAFAGAVSWGSAIEVPGVAALSPGQGDNFGGVFSVSCPSAGNCAADGLASYGHPFVASEQGGAWGAAIAVPGTAGDIVPWMGSVSCASAGNCATGGTTGQGGQAFVVSEQRGVWGTAIDVPGLPVFDGSDSGVASVSCGGARDCAAAGYYAASTDKYGDPTEYRAFVVSEHGGVWGRAHPVPTAPALGGRYVSVVNSVSCAGVGNCVVGGWYEPGRRPVSVQPFLVVERNGKWGNGIKVPGVGILSGGTGAVDAVSCATPGNCAAGGDLYPSPGYVYASHAQVFVADEKQGRWGQAIFVPGIAALNVGERASLNSISCASRGNCAAGGYYTDHAHKQHAFVVAENNGTWDKAIEVPGTAALNVGGNASATSVSCASAGNCAATGYYTDGSNKRHAFVVAERHGVWATAVEVPGTATLGVAAGLAAFSSLSISCARTGNCTVAGSYSDGSGYTHPFVTSP